MIERGRKLGRYQAWRSSAVPGVVEEEAAPVNAQLPYAERVRALAGHIQADSVVFQSAAVSALQLLDRVLCHERQVAEAAISLAQREKLQGMIQTVEATAGALREALSVQGTKMLNLCTPPETREKSEHSWWFALTETIEVLEEGTDWIASVVSSQPKGSAARTLGGIVARLLHRHHNELLEEAEQWIV